MLGIKTNCQLLSAYAGLYAGLFAGVVSLLEMNHAIGAAEFPALLGLTAMFSLSLLTGLFVTIFHQRIEDVVLPMLLPTLVIAGIVDLLMLVLPEAIGEPFILSLLGTLVGAVVGRGICALCKESKRDKPGDQAAATTEPE